MTRWRGYQHIKMFRDACERPAEVCSAVCVQLMHQLSAETQISMLAADAGALLLLASAQDAGKPTRCVAMHSLNPERGLFEAQGRVPLPPIGCPVPKTATLMQHKPQVQHLPPTW